MDNEEWDAVEAAVERLTQFYEEAMLDAGISAGLIRQVKIAVALRILDEIDHVIPKSP